MSVIGNKGLVNLWLIKSFSFEAAVPLLPSSILASSALISLTLLDPP